MHFALDFMVGIESNGVSLNDERMNLDFTEDCKMSRYSYTYGVVRHLINSDTHMKRLDIIYSRFFRIGFDVIFGIKFRAVNHMT